MIYQYLTPHRIIVKDPCQEVPVYQADHLPAYRCRRPFGRRQWTRAVLFRNTGCRIRNSTRDAGFHRGSLAEILMRKFLPRAIYADALAQSSSHRRLSRGCSRTESLPQATLMQRFLTPALSTGRMAARTKSILFRPLSN